MFGLDATVIALAGLVVFAVGGIAYAVLAPNLSNRAGKRLGRVVSPQASEAVVRRGLDPAGSRRKAVQDTLKELEEQQKARDAKSTRPSLSLRLSQAGLGWSKQTFFIISAVTGIIAAGLGFLAGAPLIVVLGLGIVGGLGLPRWYVGRRRKKRMRAFLDELPNSVDVIVRGVKAGLPLGDCFRIISTEAKEPVRSEFRAIQDAQAVGVPLDEAVLKLYEHMPVPEANFFAIVIGVQYRVGGNLSEALGNLSRVLRDRKKMKAKIRAMSMEAKASAAIIGSLPAIVMALVYITSPKYISLLWQEPVGQIVLGVSLVWMLFGILVMRKMINFEI